MVSAIGKGDWVQCIEAARTGADGVRMGGVYCVERLRPPEPGAEPCPSCGNDSDGLEFVGVPEHGEASWCPCEFRPLGGNAKTPTALAQRITEAA